MRTKKIFSDKLAKYLVSKGHVCVGLGEGKKGDKCYVFKETRRLIKDFHERAEEIKKECNRY